MSRINVLVAATSRDLMAQGIATAVDARSDMDLVRSGGGLYLVTREAGALLRSIPPSRPCAVVLVGPPEQTAKLADQVVAERSDLFVLQVEPVHDSVRIAGIALRDASLDSLLNALRELVDREGSQSRRRISRVQLRAVGEPTEAGGEPPDREAPPRPLLHAAIEWVHQVLRDAVERVPIDNGDVHGLSLTRATLLQALDTPPERSGKDVPPKLAAAAAALDRALAVADQTSEPLKAAARAFDLSLLEFRMMVLALAPELDHRYQRCAGFLLDEMGRRVGTLGLYMALLGDSARVRGELADGGALALWRAFEGPPGRPLVADEPLRLDPYLADWLLEERGALAGDPRVRRAMRLTPWAGAGLLTEREELTTADSLVRRLQGSGQPQWVLLGGDDPAGWRALIELGASAQRVEPIRIDTTRLSGVDVIEIEESGRRVGRMTRLIGAPLVVDATQAEGAEGEDDGIRLFLAAVSRTACQGALICRDAVRMARLLGAAPYDLMGEGALSKTAHVSAVRAAATGADVYLTEEAASGIAAQYPLHVDDLEHAMRLARTMPINHNATDPRLERFLTACKQVASEGVSHLAERIEPVFSLDDVVLPADRKLQLNEIVDNVRLAPTVLDGWKFREQLPYGRGVTALFFGPSGTGKTMAAMGVARSLGVQVLRLDLSMVVSKYIGETEKHINRVFTDAQRSGSAILIDEADALLGKRSEVKDAHDRYANIEVAYLLQRMEAYEGLAILTTNQRQNLDPAFVRRLRFMVDFPRPDIEAREKIWRHCLPKESHVLDDAAFRQLARRIDLTGGHIRQITLRAAFIAAAAGTQIGLKHIAQAARAEFTKLGMPPVELDLPETRRAA